MHGAELRICGWKFSELRQRMVSLVFTSEMDSTWEDNGAHTITVAYAMEPGVTQSILCLFALQVDLVRRTLGFSLLNFFACDGAMKIAIHIYKNLLLVRKSLNASSVTHLKNEVSFEKSFKGFIGIPRSVKHKGEPFRSIINDREIFIHIHWDAIRKRLNNSEN